MKIELDSVAKLRIELELHIAYEKAGNPHPNSIACREIQIKVVANTAYEQGYKKGLKDGRNL